MVGRWNFPLKLSLFRGHVNFPGEQPFVVVTSQNSVFSTWSTDSPSSIPRPLKRYQWFPCHLWKWNRKRSNAFAEHETLKDVATLAKHMEAVQRNTWTPLTTPITSRMFGVLLLLMEEILHHLGRIKLYQSAGYLPYQLVLAGFLNHQKYPRNLLMKRDRYILEVRYLK